MHTLVITAETAERRRRKLEDVQKRNSYKKAHGIDVSEGIGIWVPGEDVYAPNPDKVRDIRESLGVPADVQRAEQGAQPATTDVQAEKNTYTDFEGKRRPVKKWLGIW